MQTASLDRKEIRAEAKNTAKHLFLIYQSSAITIASSREIGLKHSKKDRILLGDMRQHKVRMEPCVVLCYHVLITVRYNSG